MYFVCTAVSDLYCSLYCSLYFVYRRSTPTTTLRWRPTRCRARWTGLRSSSSPRCASPSHSSARWGVLVHDQFTVIGLVGQTCCIPCRTRFSLAAGEARQNKVQARSSQQCTLARHFRCTCVPHCITPASHAPAHVGWHLDLYILPNP